MKFLSGWFFRFVRLSSRCAGERGPVGRDLPSCGAASRFPAAGAVPGFLVSPELSGDGEPVRHSGRLPGSGKTSSPLPERPIVRKMTCVKRVPTVLCGRPSPFPGREELAIRVSRFPFCRWPETFASQGRCRRFPVVVPTAFYRRKRICRGRGAGPMSQNALSVAGRSVSCRLSGMPGSAGPCGSRRGGLLLSRSGYR